MSLLAVGLIVGSLGLFFALAYINVPMIVWFSFWTLILLIIHVPIGTWIIFGVTTLVFNVPFIRQVVITAPIVKTIRFFKLLPTISDGERAVIEPGAVWVDGELLSGQPNFKRILTEPYVAKLSPNEQAFVDGPVAQICHMVADWNIHQRKYFPPELWTYLRQQRFFGITIPSEYGGHGFSSAALSAVMAKLSSSSFAYTALVEGGNSLGAATLLLRYGANEQKQRYLPKLATGEEISCLMLAESPAVTSLQPSGTVFRKGEELYLRLNWQSRYVTLGAIATLIGIAVYLRDPDNLLGKGTDIGITYVLVPTNTAGVNLCPDSNGFPCYSASISGRNVVLPTSQIIGGVEQAGRGWTLQMQGLVTGCGISLSAAAVGIAKRVSRVTSAYSLVQEQVNLSTDKQGNSNERLARIGGLTYLIDAARLYTCSAVDQGEQPMVLSAIVNHRLTELLCHIANDNTSILDSAGIHRHPYSLFNNAPIAAPMAILNEGTTTLTRSVIACCQGSTRRSGYIVDEITALEDNNVVAFDNAFWRHMGRLWGNLARAKILSWTRGRVAKSPVRGETARYYQKLVWASATFAAVSDLAIIAYGRRLKHHEAITDRFADMLVWMYSATAVLRRFEAEGRRIEDLAFVHWGMNHSFWQIQLALEGLLKNLDIPILGGLMRATTLPWLRLNPIGMGPTDIQNHAAAKLLQSPNGRDHLTQGVYVTTDAGQTLGQLERAYQLSVVTIPVFNKIKTALRNGELNVLPPVGRVEAALRAGLITGGESDIATAAEQAQLNVMDIGSFASAEYQHIGKGQMFGQ